MTTRKDLKRRVRERQARTGEAYVTALRHLSAERQPPFPVIELLDMTEMGRSLGMKCHVAVFPRLAERVDLRRALEQLLHVLQSTTGDPDFDLMRAAVWRGENVDPSTLKRIFAHESRFLGRVQAGIGGMCENGRTLALSIEGKTGLEMVLFLISLRPSLAYIRRAPTLTITGLDGLAADPLFDWEMKLL